jgi:hypothetical protein
VQVDDEAVTTPLPTPTTKRKRRTQLAGQEREMSMEKSSGSISHSRLTCHTQQPSTQRGQTKDSRQIHRTSRNMEIPLSGQQSART